MLVEAFHAQSPMSPDGRFNDRLTDRGPCCEGGHRVLGIFGHLEASRTTALAAQVGYRDGGSSVIDAQLEVSALGRQAQALRQ